MQPINDVVFASFPKSHYNKVQNEYHAKLIINNILGIVLGASISFCMPKVKKYKIIQNVLSISQEKRNWKRFQKVINCVQSSHTDLMASLIAISSVVQGHFSCLYTFSFYGFLPEPGTGICFVPHQIKLYKGSCNEITSSLTPPSCWNTFCNYSCSISNTSDKDKNERNILYCQSYSSN